MIAKGGHNSKLNNFEFKMLLWNKMTWPLRVSFYLEMVPFLILFGHFNLKMLLVRSEQLASKSKIVISG